MHRSMVWKWLASGTFAGVLVLGGGANLASATGADTPPTTRTVAHEHRQAHHRPGRFILRAALIKTTADLTGVSATEIVEELQDGKSLAQIAQAYGIAADELVDAVVTRAQQRLDQAVAGGTVTQEQADQWLERIRAAVPELVNTPGLGRLGKGGGRLQQRVLIKTTAEVTGLSVAQVRTELEAGKSLAEIAEENGQAGDAILNALRTKAERWLERALQRASERIHAPPAQP